MRQSLTDLRKALGEEAGRISSPTAHTLALDLAQADVDVLTFDTAMRRQDQAGLERAVALYRGPLLEGCSEEWVLPEREARQQAYHQALQRLATSALARGDTASAVSYLRRAVAVEPLREEVRRSLMQALAQSGDLNATLEVYQELVHRLRDHDARALPDTQTSALYQSLRAQARRRASASVTVPALVASSFCAIGIVVSIGVPLNRLPAQVDNLWSAPEMKGSDYRAKAIRGSERHRSCFLGHHHV